MLAEPERFELSIPFGMLPFKGSGINRYPTVPYFLIYIILAKKKAFSHYFAIFISMIILLIISKACDYVGLR